MDKSSTSSILKCAAGRWIDAHGDYLYGYALLRVGDSKIAEALLRRTLAAGLAHWDTVQEQVSERAWLISILRQEVIEHFRAVNRQCRAEPISMEDICLQKFFSTSGKWLEKPAPAASEPSKVPHPNTFAHAFHICLKEIPSALAQVFVLRELEGLEIEEICSVTKNSKANICAMLYRARLQLNRCLTEKCSGGEVVENSE